MVMVGTPLRQKIGLILFGLFLCAALLEISLRLAGLAALSLQENKNRVPLGKKKGYRIMCLGESTTAWGDGESWPAQLEKILNERNKQVRFKVINQGKPAIETAGTLLTLAENLDKYNPDMVITMLGVNDWVGTIPYENSLAVKTKLFIKGFRVYKLTRILWLHIVNKANELGFAKKIRERKGEKIILKNEIVYNKSYPQNKSMFKEFPELNHQSDSTYANLGHLYNSQKRYHEAEDMFKKALQLNPQNSSAYVGLGRCYMGQNNYQQVELAFEKALEINPNDFDAYDGLASYYNKQGRYTEAEAMFKKAIDPAFHNEGAYIDLGYFYNNQGRYEEAKTMFKKAIELNPNNANAYVGLGQCYRIEGKIEEVIGIAKKAIKIDPRFTEGYILLGNSYIEQRRYQEAEVVFKKALEIEPTYEPIYTALGRCYMAQGELKKVEELAQEIIKNKVSNDRLYGFVATSYREEGKLKEAKEYYGKANKFRQEYYNPATRHNYQKLKEAVTQRGIKLVCLQYPLRSIEPLKKLFDSTEGIIFVENKKIFEDALKDGEYQDYFEDNFGGEFGHGTPKGNKLIAENTANAILKEIFNKLSF